MKISANICNIPCPEEYYMGVKASYEAYDIEIPDENIPSVIKDIVNGKVTNKTITNIMIHK